MSLTHAEAQRLIQARADGLLPDDQAQALDEHLHDVAVAHTTWAVMHTRR